MGTIRVTAAELRNRAENLNGMNQNLKVTIEEFQKSVIELDGIWEGDAYDAFRDRAMIDRERMEQFIDAIDEFYKKLLIMARKYEITERRNAEIAGKGTH